MTTGVLILLPAGFGKVHKLKGAVSADAFECDGVELDGVKVLGDLKGLEQVVVLLPDGTTKPLRMSDKPKGE